MIRVDNVIEWAILFRFCRPACIYNPIHFNCDPFLLLGRREIHVVRPCEQMGRGPRRWWESDCKWYLVHWNHCKRKMHRAKQLHSLSSSMPILPISRVWVTNITWFEIQKAETGRKQTGSSCCDPLLRMLQGRDAKWTRSKPSKTKQYWYRTRTKSKSTNSFQSTIKPAHL